MMIEVELVEIQISEDLGPFVIILREKEGERHIPIFIGNYEVAILDQSVRGMRTPRPLTHDLLLAAITSLGGTLSGVVVDSLAGNTFLGKLLVKTPDGDTLRVDSRPSDAIVLAVKSHAPIYVEDEVLEAASRLEAEQEGHAAEDDDEEAEDEEETGEPEHEDDDE